MLHQIETKLIKQTEIIINLFYRENVKLLVIENCPWNSNLSFID